MVLDIVAVILAASAGMAVGALWFSKLMFGRRWAGLVRVELGVSPGVNYGLAFVATALTAIAVRILGEMATSTFGGHFLVTTLVATWLAWLGFTVARGAVEYLFEQRPVSLFLIDMGHQFTVVTVMGAIIGLFSH